MRIPQLLLRRFLVWLGVLIASLLFLLWGAPVAAQAQLSPKNNPPAASASQFDSSPLLKGQVPSVHLKSYSLYSASPQGVGPFQSPRVVTLRPGTTMAMNDERCYAIRDYRFSRESPASDATRFAGSSTCEPANQVHLKSAGAASLPNLHGRPSIQQCGFGYGNVCPAYPRGETAPAR
jgi:hypothetical protein